MNPFIEEQIEIKTVNPEGRLHSYNDEPAIINPNGTKLWYKNGRTHRESGPAIEYNDGHKLWFINGRNLTEREFNNREEL